MKIDGNHNINNLSNKNELKANIEAEDINPSLKGEIEPAAVYEESILEDESHVYDLLSIERLREGAEDVYGQLKDMVEGMLTDQSKALELLKQADIVELKETEITEAKEFFRPDGPRSMEAMSEKIVEFVKIASGENKGKLDALTKAIDIVFKEVEEDLKQLPEVSQKTYDRIMEKLDKLISIESLKKEPGNVDVQLKQMVEEMLTDQGKAFETLKQVDIVIVEAGIVEETGIVGETGVVEVEEFIQADSPLDVEVMSDKMIEEVLINQDKAIELLEKMKIVKTDEVTLAKVKELIGPDGKLDIETMSEKIVDFIKVASGGDKEKLNSLIKILNESFKGAENNLGQLSMVSQKTYDRIMEKLKDWEDELENRKYPGPAIFAEAMNYYRRKKTNGFQIKPYIVIIFACMILYFTIRVLR